MRYSSSGACFWFKWLKLDGKRWKKLVSWDQFEKKPFKKLHHRNYKLSDMFDFVCFSRSKQKQVLAVGGRKTVKTHTSFWEKTKNAWFLKCLPQKTSRKLSAYNWNLVCDRKNLVSPWNLLEIGSFWIPTCAEKTTYSILPLVKVSEFSSIFKSLLQRKPLQQKMRRW